MGIENDLVERLCKSLAFHAVETMLTEQFTTPHDPCTQAKIDEAKSLVAEAGFDFDVLYPVKDRPTGVLAAHIDGMLGAGL